MTDNFEKKVAVDGPVVNAGELGSSTFSPGQALPAGPLGLGQRWTVARKREVVLRLLRDEPVQLLSRQLGVEIFRLEQWREKAIGGIDASLKQRKGDPVQAELDSAMKRIGELRRWTAGGQDGDLRPRLECATSPGVDDAPLREALMQAYLELKPYAEVAPSLPPPWRQSPCDALRGLKERGFKLAILSNGSPKMLAAAVDNAGLSALFDAVLSVEEVGIYKPDRRVYQLACDRFAVAANEITFLSSNAWDVRGAANFGFQVVWMSRTRFPWTQNWLNRSVQGGPEHDR